jgi:uncharacterized protein
MVRTWQRTFRTGLLVFEAGVLAALILFRVIGTGLPFRGLFPIIILLAAAPTLFWWAWVDQRLAEAGRVSRAWTWLRILAGVYSAALLSPILLFRLHSHDLLPVPVLVWMMIWHMLLIVLGLVGLGIWIAGLLRRGLTGIAARPHDVKAPDPPADRLEATDLSRRSFLASTLALAPMILAGSTSATAMRQQGQFRVRRIRMSLPRLPERLRGLTITHVSDLHVGRLFRPGHLPALVDTVNRLDSDLIAITGDAVDHSFDYMPAACEAFGRMQSRYGRFSVIGNHDLIDSPRQAMDYLRRHEPHFLADACTDINIGGERLRIAGLSWSRYDRAMLNMPGLTERVHRMLAEADSDVFTVALSHHPHAFDVLAAAGVDLTLAGHTHGGQIMLTPPGSANPIGGGNLLFRYIWGEYWRGSSAMYVTSGVGNWFPLRINAPAEVVQIQLV